MDIYREKQIINITDEITLSGERTLIVRPMQETRFYLAGSVFIQGPKGEGLTLVRCPLNEKCNVDLVATPNPEDMSYAITVPEKYKSATVIYKD